MTTDTKNTQTDPVMDALFTDAQNALAKVAQALQARAMAQTLPAGDALLASLSPDGAGASRVQDLRKALGKVQQGTR